MFKGSLDLFVLLRDKSDFTKDSELPSVSPPSICATSWYSSVLARVLVISALGLDLKKSPTLAERRRLDFKASGSALGKPGLSLTRRRLTFKALGSALGKSGLSLTSSAATTAETTGAVLTHGTWPQWVTRSNLAVHWQISQSYKRPDKHVQTYLTNLLHITRIGCLDLLCILPKKWGIWVFLITSCASGSTLQVSRTTPWARDTPEPLFIFLLEYFPEISNKIQCMYRRCVCLYENFREGGVSRWSLAYAQKISNIRILKRATSQILRIRNKSDQY